MTQAEARPFSHGDATATVTEVVTEPAPTRTIVELVDEAAWLDTRASLLVEDATQLHTETNQLHADTVDELLRAHAAELAARPVVDLINMLGDAGFSWRDVARLVGVSVPLFAVAFG